MRSPSALGTQLTLREPQGWDWFNLRWSLCYLSWVVTAVLGMLGALGCDVWEMLPLVLLTTETFCCSWFWLSLGVFCFFLFFLFHSGHSVGNRLKEEGVWGQVHPYHQTLPEHRLSQGRGMRRTHRPLSVGPLEGPQLLCRSPAQAGPHQDAEQRPDPSLDQILVCASRDNIQTYSPWHDPAASLGVRAVCVSDGHIVSGCGHASKRAHVDVCGAQCCPPSPALPCVPLAHSSCVSPA